MAVVLWILQVLLALTFAGAGAAKLFTPVDVLQSQMPIPLPAPELSLRLIGLLEVAGALGLILPWALRIQPWLTPLAAACLAVEMVVATIYTVVGMGLMPALMPLVLAVLSAFVAYSRSRITPLPRAQPTPSEAM